MNTQNNTQNIINLKELRENMRKYIDAAQKGESFLVMKRSEPVFRITPPDEDDAWETVADLTQIEKGGVTLEEVQEAISQMS